MRILLIGEYSGFHNALKDGLVSLGHDVVLAARGDTFKKISRDIEWEVESPLLTRKISAYFKQFIDIVNLKHFDVIQFIGPGEFNPRLGYNRFVMRYLMKNNTKSFLVIAADDCTVWNYYKDRTLSSSFEYNWVRDIVKFNSQEQLVMKWCEDSAYRNKLDQIKQKMVKIIPIAYEYFKPYENYTNINQIIRMPINTDKVQYMPNKVNNKLVVFHGLNREAAKGTPYIRKAFEILKKKYPNDLELVIDGQMPLKEYLNFIRGVNVVVDQTSSYSLAMNALYSMAMGKVVMGGAEPESIIANGYDFMPAINIKPDYQQIVSQIEQLLEQKDQVENIGLNSRKFVEQYHDYRIIAKQYEDLFLLCK